MKDEVRRILNPLGGAVCVIGAGTLLGGFMFGPRWLADASGGGTVGVDAYVSDAERPDRAVVRFHARGGSSAEVGVVGYDVLANPPWAQIEVERPPSDGPLPVQVGYAMVRARTSGGYTSYHDAAGTAVIDVPIPARPTGFGGRLAGGLVVTFAYEAGVLLSGLWFLAFRKDLPAKGAGVLPVLMIWAISGFPVLYWFATLPLAWALAADGIQTPLAVALGAAPWLLFVAMARPWRMRW